jgi:hypothetical protein
MAKIPLQDRSRSGSRGGTDLSSCPARSTELISPTALPSGKAPFGSSDAFNEKTKMMKRNKTAKPKSKAGQALSRGAKRLESDTKKFGREMRDGMDKDLRKLRTDAKKGADKLKRKTRRAAS